MWERIEETVDRAVSGIIYSIWGRVGFGTKYDIEKKEVGLIVWNKSYKCEDKEVIIEKVFKFDLENMSELKAKHDVIADIEKYLLENYS